MEREEINAEVRKSGACVSSWKRDLPREWTVQLPLKPNRRKPEMWKGGSHSRPYISFGKHLFIISCHLPLSPSPLCPLPLVGCHYLDMPRVVPTQHTTVRLPPPSPVPPTPKCSDRPTPDSFTPTLHALGLYHHPSHSRFFLLSPQAPVNDLSNDPLTKLSSVIQATAFLISYLEQITATLSAVHSYRNPSSAPH